MKLVSSLPWILVLIVFVSWAGLQSVNSQTIHEKETLDKVIKVSLPDLPEKAKPLEMVLISAGTYIMGCPSTERKYLGREWPPHEVTISESFYFGRYEITQAQWFSVMKTRPAKNYGVGMNHPVYNVSWNECQQFIEKINTLGLGGFRLPTEAEWEYACRAGTRTRFSFGDALDCDDARKYETLYDKYMWWGGNNGKEGYSEGCKEVGLKTPNPWGLYDIHGNVWEWCSDWWQDPEDRGKQVDPQGPEEGTHKVFRGGAWESHALHLRSSDRTRVTPDDKKYGRLIGLRLVRNAR